MAKNNAFQMLIKELAEAGKTVVAVGVGVAGGKIIVRGIDEIMNKSGVSGVLGGKATDVIRKGIKPLFLLSTTAATHYFTKNKKTNWNKLYRLASVGAGIVGLDEAVKIFNNNQGLLGLGEGMEITPIGESSNYYPELENVYRGIREIPESKFLDINSPI